MDDVREGGWEGSWSIRDGRMEDGEGRRMGGKK